MEIDYIVPLWKLDDYRLRNLDLLRNSVSKQAGVVPNFVVIEQDSEDNPVFNKGWLQNKGVDLGRADHLFIGDVDVPLPRIDFLSKVTGWAIHNKYHWGFAWNRLIYEGEPGAPPQRDDRPKPGIQEGGIVYFRRSLWNLMGGANEWIQELRGPDNDLALRASFLSSQYPAYNATLVHKWHPRSPMKNTTFRKMNEEILAVTKKHPGKVIELLRKQIRGNPKGPYCNELSFFNAIAAEFHQPENDPPHPAHNI